MTPRGKVDPAAGVVRVRECADYPHDKWAVWVRIAQGVEVCALVHPNEEIVRMRAKNIRACIRYAVQKSRESGRRRGR